MLVLDEMNIEGPRDPSVFQIARKQEQAPEGPLLEHSTNFVKWQERSLDGLEAVFGEEGPCGIVVCNLHTYSVSLVCLALLHPGCQHPPSLLFAQELWNEYCGRPPIGSPQVVRRKDAGFLSYKDHLPVSQVVAGDTDRQGSEAKLSVGPLRCQGDSKFAQQLWLTLSYYIEIVFLGCSEDARKQTCSSKTSHNTSGVR
ncbi:hypothetical protein STEG23_019054 [Scotinomys teguina]